MVPRLGRARFAAGNRKKVETIRQRARRQAGPSGTGLASRAAVKADRTRSAETTSPVQRQATVAATLRPRRLTSVIRLRDQLEL